VDNFINTGTRIEYLVYIAGVKVPCSAVSVSCSDGGTVTATVSLPPNETILNLGMGDRTQVSIFYLDSWKYKENPTWCLLAEGYIAGLQYTNSVTSKSIGINISSNLNILNSMYLEFLGGGESSSGKVGKPNNVVPNEITFKGKFPGQLFTVGLENKNQIRAPYELIQNIFLATTGEYKDKDNVKSASKLDITQEVDRIQSLVKLNYDEKTKQMTDQEKQEYEKQEKQRLQKELLSVKSPKAANLESIVDLQKEVVKLEVEKILKDRNLNARTPVSSGFFYRFFTLTRLQKHILASPMLEGLIYTTKDKEKEPKMPSGVFPMLRTSRGSQYVKALAAQSGFKSGENGSAKALLTNLFSIFNYNITEIASPPIFSTDNRGLAIGKYSSGGNSNTIGSFLSKPNTYFSVPPACNVIFPSMRLTMSHGVAYEGMPTRVYFQKTSQGRKLNLDNKLGDGYAHMDSRVGYPASIARHAIDSSKAPRNELEVLVFPEEYYSGPKTVYKEINPMLHEIDKIEKASRLKDETEKIATSTLSQLDTGSLRADQAAFAREAFTKAKTKGQNNYDLYLKQAQIEYETLRANSTSCTVSMVFNPYIVPGFSCIVADQETVGGHLIGHVVNVSHNITSYNSNTTVELTSVRSLKSVIEGILLDGGKYDMSPLEPISEVRAILQKTEAANFYYAHLLYRDSEDKFQDSKELNTLFSKIAEHRTKIVKLESELEKLIIKGNAADQEAKDKLYYDILEENNKLNLILEQSANQNTLNSQAKIKAACDYRKIFSLVEKSKGQDYKDDDLIQIDTGRLLRDYTEVSDSQYVTSRVDVLNSFSKLKLVYNGYLPRILANSYDAAMEYVSRPVCTLEQYIDFYKNAEVTGVTKFTGGRGRGIRVGKQYIDGKDGYGTHYSIIREFVGGPGVEPGSKVPKNSKSLRLNYITEGPNNSLTRANFAEIQPGSKASVTQLPDTILDWQELLLDYIEQLKLSGVIK
jgi:hypothetical protein